MNRYEQDFYVWTQEQASLLRSGRLSDIDVEHLAEEIESMGGSERRELFSRSVRLLAHLLKWQYQSERQGASWRNTIKEQRRALGMLLKDSPSLRPKLIEMFPEIYLAVSDDALDETRFDKAPWPDASPYTVEQMLDKDFWPAC